MTTLTKTERLVLEHLKSLGPTATTYPAALGHVIWEAADPNTRKRNPSPQGLALLAGRYTSRLEKKKWVSLYKGIKITASGRRILENSK